MEIKNKKAILVVCLVILGIVAVWALSSRYTGKGPLANLDGMKSDASEGDNDFVTMEQFFDLNNDGKINRTDVQLQQKCQVGSAICTLAKNDFNKDGQMNSADTMMIHRVSLGLTPTANLYDMTGDGKVDHIDVAIEQGCQIGVGICPLSRHDFNKDRKILSNDVMMITRASKGLAPDSNIFDLNLDGRVTSADSEIMKQCTVGIGTCSNNRHDFNKDGKLTVIDLTMIQRVVSGLAPTANVYDLNGDGKVDSVDVEIEQRCTVGLGACALGRNDFNRDRKINSVDLTMITRVSKGLPATETTAVNPYLATYDLNKDGKVDGADVEIQQGCQIGMGSCLLAKNDFNKDGQMNSVDTMMITRVSKGLSPQ